MSFGSFGAGFGSFGAGVGGLLPSFTNITSWLKAPTTDGKTLANSKGTDANLTGVNCLSFDGTDDEVVFGTHAIPASDSIEVVFTPQDEADRGALYSQGSLAGSFGYSITWDGSQDRIFARSNGGATTNVTTATNSCVANGTTYKVTYTYDSSAGTITLVLFNNNTGATIETVAKTGLASNIFNTGASRPVKVGEDQANLDDYLGKIHYAKSSFGEWAFAEGSGTKIYDVSGNGNHGTITGASWATENGVSSWNHEYGHDLVGVLNGTVSGFDTGIGGDELDMYEIKIQSTSDAGGDGNSYFVENGATNPTLFMTNSTEGSGKRMSFRIPNNTFEQMSGISSADFNIYKVDYTNTSSVKVFVNGELELTSSQTVTPTTAHYHIGNDSAAGASDNGFFYYFKGWKDGVLKIYAVLDPSGRVRDLVSGNLLTADVGGTGSLGIKRIPALNTKTKQVATFDGVADNVLSNTTGLGAGDFYYGLKFKYKFKASAYLFSDGNTASSQGGAWSALQYGGSTGALIFVTDDDTTKVEELIIANGTIPDNSIIEGYIQRVGGTISFNLTNLTNSAVYSGSYSNTTNFFHSNANRKLVLGGVYTSSAVGSEATVEWFDFKAGTTSTNLVRHYDFQSDIGTTTVQDTTANNNDGTVTVGSGGTATFWGQRVADTLGSLVSADYATLNGTTFNNSAGFVHNGSECGVAMVTNSLTSTDLFAINNASATETFVRKDNGNIIQILDYSDHLTGNDLTRTRNYVG